MATNYGLLVARFNTATPSYSIDNDLRELRIDAGGRLYSRLADGNNNTVSWFKDGDAFGSGVGGDTTGDRGVLVLGKDSVDSIYRVLSLNSDGSLNVTFNAGTDISAAADKANANDGEVALTVGTWVLVDTIPVTTGHVQISGYSYCSDKNTVFQLAMATGATITRTSITEIIDTQMSISGRPSDHVAFNRDVTKAGAANTALTLWAKQIQVGATGVAMCSINAATTT